MRGSIHESETIFKGYVNGLGTHRPTAPVHRAGLANRLGVPMPPPPPPARTRAAPHVRPNRLLRKRSTGMIKRWQTRNFELAGHYLKYSMTTEEAPGGGEEDGVAAPEIRGAFDLSGLTK